MVVEIRERNKLAEFLGCTPYTLRVYLCRAEFSHITHKRIDRKMYYVGITRKDLALLRKQIEERPKGCRKGIVKGSIC